MTPGDWLGGGIGKGCAVAAFTDATSLATLRGLDAASRGGSVGKVIALPYAAYDTSSVFASEPVVVSPLAVSAAFAVEEEASRLALVALDGFSAAAAIGAANEITQTIISIATQDWALEQ
jgi:hypothetical protein